MLEKIVRKPINSLLADSPLGVCRDDGPQGFCAIGRHDAVVVLLLLKQGRQAGFVPSAPA
jgi:hypothetical protein